MSIDFKKIKDVIISSVIHDKHLVGMLTPADTEALFLTASLKGS